MSKRNIGRMKIIGPSGAKSVIRELSRSGDEVLEYDKTKTKELSEAKELFDKVMKKGFTPFMNVPKGPPEQIRSFDPNADEITFVPPLVGG